MREDPTTRTGDTGEYEVAANFSRIGWGPVANTRRDLGTDVFVQARDRRGFDLGLFLGVQVKTGKSFFEEEERDEEGNLTGWWYYEPGVQHFDDWVSHGLPHLLVLHDLKNRESYWAHVTAPAVTVTGEGAKILVPANQAVNDANLDLLVAVAATQKQGITFEGSAWRAAAAEVSPARRLRTALIAPRLIAPHRNVGYSRPISPEEAVALLVQCRIRDLEEFSKRHRGVPTTEEAATKRDWRWKFFAALAPAVLRSDYSQLQACISKTTKPERKTVAAVALACWLLEYERFDEAIVLLEKFGDKAGPVDSAWVLSQLARAQAEIGKIDEARSNAVLALQSTAAGTGEDATVSAIRAAAAGILYYTADFRGKNLADVVSTGDHAAAWWRTQVQAWGLSEILDRSYRKAMHDQSKRFGFEEAGHNRLYSSILMSTFAGDQGAWSNATRLLSLNTITTGSGSPGAIADAIDDLRRCGARSAIILAAKHAWAWEPSEALGIALERAAERGWSHTSASSTLALIHHGGDLAVADQADSFSRDLLTILDDSTSFVKRVNPSFAVPIYVLDALQGIAGSCSGDMRDVIAKHLAGLPSISNAAFSNGYARVAARLLEGFDAGPDLAHALYESALRQSDQRLSSRLLGIASVGSEQARQAVLQRARDGDREALSAFGDIRALSADDAAKLAEKDAALLRRMMKEAESGTFGIWSYDPAYSSAQLGAWFNEAVNWELMAEFLKHPQVPGEHKRDCCVALAHNVTRLPEAARDLLATVAPHLNDAPFDVMLGRPLGGAGVYLAAALGVLDEKSLSKQIVELLASSSERRGDSAMMIGHMNRSDLIPISVGLVGDADPEVRLSAATSLAIHIAKAGDSASPMAIESVRGIICSQGVAMALRVANALSGEGSTDSEIGRELAHELSEHGSALVRLRVKKLIVGDAGGDI